MKQSSPLNHATPSDYGSTSFINRSNSRKKWCLIGLPAALVLLVLIIVVSVVTTRKDGKDDKIPVGSQAIRTVCTETRYPETCTSTLNQYPNRDLANPRDLALYVIKTLELALNQSLDSINTTIPTVQNPNVTKVLEDCYEVSHCVISKSTIRVRVHDSPLRAAIDVLACNWIHCRVSPL